MADEKIVTGSFNILVVEDEAIVAMSLVSYLEEVGATVTWAPSTAQALAQINKLPAIDLAIVDLNLYGKVSTSVLDRLASRRVCTMLCTGYDVNVIEERFRALPRIEKPFTRARIRAVLNARL